MSITRRTLMQHAVDWALGTLACFGLLMLMAWMDCRKAEADALRLSIAESNDRAAQLATAKGPR
ncbi:hypothetical protein ABL840_26915 [Variovorax sp. NFACC27]|uniref:hypothetical protein n=1 Tax=unclassified Variovorax TaxID=663243 RepID=UPI000B88AAF5